MDHPSIRILVLIPAYNEAEHVGTVVKTARQFLPVLVVDDGSMDDTASAAEAAGAEVISMVHNQGKGTALRQGFHRALTTGYSAVITLDADGQHDAGEIPKFIEFYHARAADLVIGKRDFSQMPPARRLANNLGALAFSWAIGKQIPDNQSGFRLISRRLMAALTDSQEPGFEFEVEMISACVRFGFQLEWIPIQTIYTGEGSHIQPLKHIKGFSRLVWETRRSR
jgi:glycosyltransferase involved in cell wall biosynthesis